MNKARVCVLSVLVWCVLSCQSGLGGPAGPIPIDAFPELFRSLLD